MVGNDFITVVEGGKRFYWGFGKKLFGDAVQFDDPNDARGVKHDALSNLCSQVHPSAWKKALSQLARFLHADDEYRLEYLVFGAKHLCPGSIKVLKLLVHYFLPRKELDVETDAAMRWLDAADEKLNESDRKKLESFYWLMIVQGLNVAPNLHKFCLKYPHLVRRYAGELVQLPGMDVLVATALAEANDTLYEELDFWKGSYEQLYEQLGKARKVISEVQRAISRTQDTDADDGTPPRSLTSPSYNPTSPSYSPGRV
jgi:hypothetical protein